MSRARSEWIRGLRAVADLYEHNPRAYYDGMHLTLNMYVGGREARSTLAEMAGIFGDCDKTCDDRSITVSRSFSEQITLAVFCTVRPGVPSGGNRRAHLIHRKFGNAFARLQWFLASRVLLPRL